MLQIQYSIQYYTHIHTCNTKVKNIEMYLKQPSILYEKVAERRCREIIKQLVGPLFKYSFS